MTISAKGREAVRRYIVICDLTAKVLDVQTELNRLVGPPQAIPLASLPDYGKARLVTRLIGLGATEIEASAGADCVSLVHVLTGRLSEFADEARSKGLALLGNRWADELAVQDRLMSKDEG